MSRSRNLPAKPALLSVSGPLSHAMPTMTYPGKRRLSFKPTLACAQAAMAGTLLATMVADGHLVHAQTTAPQSAGPVSTLSPVMVKGDAGDGATGLSDSYTTAGPSMSATGLGLTLRETPQSVSIITSQRMKDQKLTQLVDVANQTAGLVVNQSGNVGSDSSPIMSRGFTVDTYLVDGVKQVTSGYSSIFQSQDMSLYDRVEIVRGAAGLMNGTGSPGAAINLIRKKPYSDFHVEGSLDVGSWSYKRGLLDLSTPLNEAKTVRGRFVLMGQDSDSYIDRLNEKRQAFYGVVEADVTESTLVRAGISHQRHDLTGHSRGGLPAYYSDGTLIDWDRSDSAAPNWAYSKRHVTSMFAELEQRLSDTWDLKLSASRTYTDADEVVGYAGGGTPDRLTGAGASIWASHWKYRPRQDVLNLATQGTFRLFNRDHDLAVGGTLSRSSYTSPSFTNWTHEGWDGSVPNIFDWDGSYPLEPANPAVGTHSADERNHGAYASLRLRPTDELSVILGTRYVDWSRLQANHSYSTGITTATNRSEREFIPYAGIVYDFSEHWSGYASYTNIFTPQNNKLVDGSYIDPLIGNSYEIGVKASFLEDRLNISAALYEIQEDNKPIALQDVYAPDGSQAYEAKSGTKTRGFEFEVNGRLRPDWEVAASFAHNNTKDAESVRINTNVPQNIAKLFTRYTIPSLGNGLTIGGGVRWQSKIYSDNMGPNLVRNTQPAYAVVDLMARYPISKNLSASVNLNNIFDKHYRTSTGNSYYGAPRSIYVSLNGQF